MHFGAGYGVQCGARCSVVHHGVVLGAVAGNCFRNWKNTGEGRVGLLVSLNTVGLQMSRLVKHEGWVFGGELT